MTCCRYRDLEQYFRFRFTLLYCIMHAIPGLRQQIFLLPLHTGGPYKAHGPLDSVQPVWPKVTVSNQIACAAHVHLHYSVSFFIVFR